MTNRIPAPTAAPKLDSGQALSSSDTAIEPSLVLRLGRVVSADLVVLRRRALLWGAYGAVGLITALITVVTFATASGTGALPAGPGAQGASVADLQSSTGMLSGLSSAVSILGVIALCVAAAHLAGMFASGTIRNSLVRSPGRVTLVAGKAAALSIFLLGAVLVATLAGLVSAYASAPMADIDTSAWTSSPGDLIEGVGYVALAVLGYGLIGTCLGLAVRTPVPAVAIGIGWLLPIETILRGTVDGSARWLPGQLLSAVASGGTDDVALGMALVTLTAYLVIALTASTIWFVRRDVTS